MGFNSGFKGLKKLSVFHIIYVDQILSGEVEKFWRRWLWPYSATMSVFAQINWV